MIYAGKPNFRWDSNSDHLELELQPLPPRGSRVNSVVIQHFIAWSSVVVPTEAPLSYHKGRWYWESWNSKPSDLSQNPLLKSNHTRERERERERERRLLHFNFSFSFKKGSLEILAESEIQFSLRKKISKSSKNSLELNPVKFQPVVEIKIWQHWAYLDVELERACLGWS